jgi:RHS repeat-associated protein
MAFTSDGGVRASGVRATGVLAAGGRFASWLAGLILGMAAFAAQGAASLSCGPTQLGAPCGDAGPATQSLGDGPGPGAGNPVNVATGNKYQRETDMPPLPGVLGLELVRHYNSFDTRRGPWGTGWTLSYDTRLYRVGDSIQIVQADGSRLSFAARPGSELCTPENPSHGTLRLLDPEVDGKGNDVGDGGYAWHWRGGRVLWFDRAGGLVRIEAGNGQAVSIQRGRVPGHASYRQIVQVTDPAGRSLVLQYASGTGAVSAASTPAGVLQYHQAGGRLQAVIYPDGHWRGYLYEARHQAGAASRLTGIVAGRPLGRAASLQHASEGGSSPHADGSLVRLNTWIYDARGRVVTSIPGAPDSTLGRLDIRYGDEPASRAGRQPGRAAPHRIATVSDEQGRETRFHLGVKGGRHVVLGVEGHGCAGCPPVGSEIGYDRLGNAADVAGLDILRDERGRVVRLGARPEVHVQWWRDTSLPGQVRLPSVVPGRQHVIRIAWQSEHAGISSHAVPVRIEEAGWRPGSPPQPISRRIDLAWRQSGAAGVALQDVQADGPVTSMPGEPAFTQGWPGFSEVLDDFGNVVQWHSSATGTEHRSYDGSSRLQERVFANGTRWRYVYDAAGRLVRLQSATNAGSGQDSERDSGWASAHRDDVGIRWEGGFPVHVENRFERQANRYDTQGRLVERRIEGPTLSDGEAAFAYSERFERDAAGRVIRHFLPEGGALFYEWGQGRTLRSIHWVDAVGRVHVLLDSVPGRQGYMQGNGVRMQWALQDGRLAGLAYSRRDELVWAQALGYDTAGRIVSESIRRGQGHARHEQYGHDERSRLAAAGHDWYAWAEDGSLARRHHAGRTSTPAIDRDASGLPTRVAGRTLQYGANRRLVEVREAGRVLARYRHNAFGERIVRSGSDGVTHFLFHERQVVAEWRGDGRHGGVVRRYVHAHGVPVAMIRYAAPQRFRKPVGLFSSLRNAAQAGEIPDLVRMGREGWRDAAAGLPPDADVHAIHSDAIGLPRVVTDARGRIRWAAEHSVFGQATVLPGSIDMPLRLPGQVFDADTGWHDNYQRTYDPQAGHYLEPDPLGAVHASRDDMHGLAPLTSAFGYAAQQPRRYADPPGLVLFAFDGTREGPATATNVYQMALLYRHAGDMRAGVADIHYQPGPGDPRRPDLDAAVASSADAIVSAQWSRLLQHLSAFQASDQAATIDLVGYSRGAALARHFANQVVQNTRRGRFWQRDARHGTVTACVDLRFMGLFDSVAQFGLLGSRNHEYDFSIAPDWELVAHAVALHEHRALFPLLSTADASGQLPTNVIEQPFVGAHGDIGGGLVQARPEGEDTHDLSDMALAWMLGLARSAGLVLDTPQPAQQAVSDPVLHDMRASSQRVSQRLHEAYGESPAWPRSDREVRSARDTQLARYQGDHERYGLQTRAQTEAFIRRVAGWTESSEPVVGIVDMEAYAAWLASP